MVFRITFEKTFATEETVASLAMPNYQLTMHNAQLLCFFTKGVPNNVQGPSAALEMTCGGSDQREDDRRFGYFDFVALRPGEFFLYLQ